MAELFTETTATKKIAALKKRIKAVQGGTSASKTISILLVLIAKAQTDKTPKLTSIVSESFPHLKRGAMRDFLNIMQTHHYYRDELWNRTNFIYTFETGSTIEFFSADSADKVRGPRRDRLFINEANNVSLETYNQLEVRTRDEIYMDWNPTNEFWFYTDVLVDRKPDIDHIIITYKDNEALEQSIVESIESRRGRKGWWQVYGEGQLGEVEGKIYKNWKKITEIPHEARLERRGLDFGYSNDPTAIVDVYYYNGGFIFDEQFYRKGMSNKQIADVINNLEKPETLVIADSAEPKSIDELRLYGVSVVGANKGANSVRQGINYMQDQQISFTSRSINLEKAYKNYLWKIDKDGRILNEPDHYLSDLMDAARYAMETYQRQEDEEPVRPSPINTLMY